MRRNAVLGMLAVFVAGALVNGCTEGTSLRRMAPIQPLATYEGDYADIIIDTETRPQPTLELTKEDVTVRVQYWRKADLDRKFNRGSMTSPFYFEPTWKQSERVTVFKISITNNLDKPLRMKRITDMDPPYLFIEDNIRLRADMDANRYVAMPEEELRNRLLYKKGQTLDITNGLDGIHAELFEEKMKRLNGEVPAGETVEGWAPFFGVKPNAVDLKLNVSIETPPDSEIGRYQKLDFVFPYVFDRSIYEAQPATIRY